METNDVGRTEQFTPVQVAAAAGAMVDVSITGHDGRQLLTTSRPPVPSV
jgi:hypothetical protein